VGDVIHVTITIKWEAKGRERETAYQTFSAKRRRRGVGPGGKEDTGDPDALEFWREKRRRGFPFLSGRRGVRDGKNKAKTTGYQRAPEESEGR